jgi:glycosyltransferase involved in cell wall biosynthesis
VTEPHSGSPEPITGAIIIPAHNEAGVIAGTLHKLAPLLGNPGIDIIVVCNGCADDTAAIARRQSGVTVLETSVSSKPSAMNLGDRATSHWPRLYLDADIAVDPSAVEAVFRELGREGRIVAARPTAVMDTHDSSFPVRAYYRARARIPEKGTRLWGAGLYAASEAGHSKFERFPEVTADDSYFDSLFDETEKTIVATAPALIRAPRTSGALLQILSRHRRGFVELDTAAAASSDRPVALLRTIRGVPSAFDAVWYAAFAVAARIRTRRDVGAGTRKWETDGSTRAARPASHGTVGAR